MLNNDETGKKVFEEFTTGTKHHLTSEISEIAPDIEKYILDFVFGTIYAGDGLNEQEKAITTITTLTAIGGCETELITHFNTAINVGADPKKSLIH